MSMPSGSQWQPKEIRQFVRNFDSGAGTILVETDLGKGYLKAIGNPGGEHILACEWVGTQLARWLGLPTFDFGIIPVTKDDELAFARGGKARPGPAFISRAESGQPWGGKKRELRRLINPQDIGPLVVFDTWTLNCDRHSVKDDGKPRINRDNVFLSQEAPKGKFQLKAMDHTHCFACGRDLTGKIASIDRKRDKRIYGAFKEFRSFLDREGIQRAATRLTTLRKEVVVAMVRAIPREWDVSAEARDALVDLVLGRAGFIAENIISSLWPQGELFKDETKDQP